MKPKTLLLSAGLLLPFASPLQAAVWTSSATGGTNWADAGNWSGGVAPAEGEAIELGIPVSGGSRVTNNNLLTSIGSLWLKANLNEANGNAVTLNGNSVRYTAGGTSIGKIGMAITLTQDTTYEVSATTSSGRLEVGGDITGSFGINKTEAGRLRFVGTAKTYTGTTTISAGLLDMSADNMLPFGTGKGNVAIGNGGELFLNNVNTQINGLNDLAAGNFGVVNKTGSNSRSLTLGNGDANGSFSGNMTFTGGSSTINKVGSGTQVLNGNISTAGTGVVSGGTLLLNGTWSSGLNAAATATVGGTGSIAGALTVASGGTVAPGTSIGTLTVGSAVISGTLLTEFNGTGGGTVDLLTVTGALDIAAATVDFNQIGGIADDPFYVFAKYGSLTGTFASIVDLPAGYEINYAFNNGSSTNNIALVAVPEPAAAALGALGLLTLLRRRR